MPGTHSKWVTLEQGAVADFATVMTGELFSLIRSQSIVRHSIGEAKPSNSAASTAFQDGLAIGIDAPEKAIERLFSLRALQLLFGGEGVDIADRLSGILIGAEVASHFARDSGTVELIASGPIADLYGEAIRMAGGAVRVTDADAAVRGGLAHAAGILFERVAS
jgi:2-dehydro-3-deoxygalactonokinase